MPSRVLLVTNEYPPDAIRGTATATRFLAEELNARGLSVAVVVNTRLRAPAREETGGISVSRLRPLGLPATRMAQRAAFLVSVARRFRPDVIQGQSLSCGFLALLAGRCLGIPAVTYVQGQDLYLAGRWARQTYVRWALAYSDGVVTVTDDLRSRALALSGRQGHVIPHGLKLRVEHDLEPAAARAALDLPRDVPLVLFVGRLLALKGVHHLIRAMAEVGARCPDARLVVVGGGEELPSLTRVVGDLGLADRVRFVGERSHEDVIRFMRAADVFVLPSLTEAFGVVLLEAMSCGLPVVASNVDGIPSLVSDGQNGFLVPAGDEGALAYAIARVLTEPEERAVFARTNVQKAMTYAWPGIAERFLRLWDDVATSRRTARAPTGVHPGPGETP